MNLTLAAIVILSLWVVGIVVAGLVLTLRPGGVGIRFGGPMAPTPTTGQRLEILLGGEAEVLGNPRGSVRAVLVRPDDRRLLGIELGGGLIEGEAIPAAAVVDADGQTTYLNDQWDELPLDQLNNVATLAGNVAVVSADGKRIGRLRVVCVDQRSGVVTALVATTRMTPSERLVPMERVLEAGPASVMTDLRAGDVVGLAVFATDWDLRQQLQSVLGSDPEVRRSLRIDVHDQRVRIQGYVADQAQADRVATLVRSVPGILELDVKLLTDADLAQAIQSALNRDPQTSVAQVQVIARTGIVDIVGEVPDRPTARRIETVARQVDGVEVIHNMVTVGTTQHASA